MSRAGTEEISRADEQRDAQHLPGDSPAAAAPGAPAAGLAVSVVICAFTEDRWEDLTRAVRSLRHQTRAPYEVILITDHCPGLLWRARRHLPGVNVKPSRFEKGLSGARNTGVAEAHGDIVAFLDDDAAADPEWIARLTDAYADPKVAGVGGFVNPAWESGRPGWFPPELDWVVGCSYQGMAPRGPVRNFIGANMSFRRQILRDVGGFTAGLGRVGSTPLGCEETELCIRVSGSYPDSVLFYEPAAIVNHKVGQQRAGWRYLRSRCYAEGLSKAGVAQARGSGPALSSERAYVAVAIPRAVVRSLASVARGKLSGIPAALALIMAVALTALGYAVGRTAPAGAPGTPGGPVLAPAGGVRTRSAAAVAARRVCWALLPWACVSISTALWVSALRRVNVAAIATSGLGLVSELPPAYWAALGLLLVSFALAVAAKRPSSSVLAVHVVVLVAILHATPAILYQTLRYSWTWKHIGVTDYIVHHGIDFSLGGVLGPYQGWPGFFALNALLVSAAGLHTALSYAQWALPLNDLLWLGPVALLARAFTRDQRLIWTAAVLFELANWVGQDYFSPQAFAFFLYLAVLAVCVRWLWDPSSAWHTPGVIAPIGPRRPGQRVVAFLQALPKLPLRILSAVPPLRAVATVPPLKALAARRARRPRVMDTDYMFPEDGPAPSKTARLVLAAATVPLMAAITSSHQLTPFMLLSGLVVLAMFRWLRPWWLPLAMAAVIAAWLAFGAWPWLSSNTDQILQGVGGLWSNTSSHLVGVSQVPFDQVIVSWGVRLLSLITGLLAIVGFFRYRRHHGGRARRSWTRVVLLAVAPIPLAGANAYGGEIIFRVFLFALPFMAIAGAAAFFPREASRPSRWAPVALAVTCLLLAGGFCLGNYGQEAIDYFTPSEVGASNWLYRTALPGAMIVGADSNFPWAFTHYNIYGYTFLDGDAQLSNEVISGVRHNNLGPVVTVMQPGSPAPSYLVLTTSQAQEILLGGAWPPGIYSHLTHLLLNSGKFWVVYSAPNVKILELSPAGNDIATGRPAA